MLSLTTESPRKKEIIIDSLCETDIVQVNKLQLQESSKEDARNSSDKFETMSNGKKSSPSKSNSRKKISFSIDQTKLPLKNRLFIFKKNNKSKAETTDIYLKTETPLLKDNETEVREFLPTDTADRSSTLTTFSYKKLNSLTNKNLSLKANYVSTNDTKSVQLTKRTENVKNDLKSPSIKFNATNTLKTTPQKETPLKNYLNLVLLLLTKNVYPQNVQNGTKMFTKIKINPNIQFLIKDFKHKVINKSVNKDRENTLKKIHYTQTEASDNPRKPTKKVLNFTGNYKNHSISSSNKVTDYSQVQTKPDTSTSKERKRFDTSVQPLLTDGNIAPKKFGSVTKPNIASSGMERFNTLTSFFNKNSVAEKVSSPKLQKIISTEKGNTFNYRMVKPKLGSSREKKDVTFNKNEMVFPIDDPIKIKEKIFNFCKRNLFSITEVT